MVNHINIYQMLSIKLIVLLFAAALAFKIQTDFNTQIHESQSHHLSLFSQNNLSQGNLPLSILGFDVIYYNGHIITMDNKDKILESIAIKNGKIVWVGSSKKILPFLPKYSHQGKLINLQGKTMLPGFYDAHSHLSFLSIQKSLGFQISSPPIGGVTSISQLQQVIRQFIKSNNIPPTVIIYGSSYNDLGLKERRHPSRIDLDEISKDHIIVLDHISGHMAAVNSRACEEAGVNSETPDPAGGKIVRFQSGPYAGTPYGVFKQKAKANFIDRFYTKLDFSQASKNILLKGSEVYIQAGVTTAQEGYMSKLSADLYLQLKDQIKIDVRGYFSCIDTFSTNFDQYVNKSTSKFQVAGIKIVVDGSLQGYTGFLTQPYYVQPVDTEIPEQPICSASHYAQNQCKFRSQDELLNKVKQTKQKNDKIKQQVEEQNYKGFATYNQDQIDSMVYQGFKRNIDILSHCNGDAAADMYISAVKQARAIFPHSTSRITMIHAQTIRQDQILAMKQLRIAASFFIGHTYYWGDDHKNTILGPIRAARISPAASSISKGLNVTLHNDAPIVPMEKNGMFMIAWSAVNRLTQSGEVLGPDERISVYEALKSLTIRSAIQGNQQKVKGSIEVGKLADLIIVSQNPLVIDSLRLKQIKILETIKNGKSIFQSKND